MENINIGDKVRFLNDVGGGKVTGFRQGGIVLVEDEDGFEVPMRQNEVVVIESKESAGPQVKAESYSTIPQPKPRKPEREEPPTEEDIRIKELRELYNRENAQRKTQVIEKPAEQPHVAAAESESLEERVLRLEMTVKRLQMRIERLEDAKALREKVKQETKERRELQRLQKDGILEIDLHADEVLETTAGMDAKAIKEYQLDVFRKTMQERLQEKGRKIVFIHGNGEGVLRKAIIDELRRSYKLCEYQDASFQQYGFGATMVIIK